MTSRTCEHCGHSIYAHSPRPARQTDLVCAYCECREVPPQAVDELEACATAAACGRLTDEQEAQLMLLNGSVKPGIVREVGWRAVLIPVGLAVGGWAAVAAIVWLLWLLAWAAEGLRW